MSDKKMVNPRNAYGDALVGLGKKNKNLVVLDADLSKSTKTINFAKTYPKRFFQMGFQFLQHKDCVAMRQQLVGQIHREGMAGFDFQP